MAKRSTTTSAKTSQAQTPKPQTPKATSSQQQNAQTDAIALLKADHRKVEQLFQKFAAADAGEAKQQLVKQICTELIVHTKLEEEIFYPACREKQVADDSLDEAQVEHDSAKILIGELMSQSPDSQFYDAKVSVLSEYIKHHVGEEEKPSDGIFARATTAAVDMNALGQRLQARRQELLSKAETQGFRPPQPRALELSHFETRNIQEYQAMDRRFDRDRDEQGRFTSDDDDRNDRRYSSRSGRDDDYGRSSRSGGRDDDRRDGDNGGRSSRSNERDRDEYGRFTRDDDRSDYYRGRASGSSDRERDESGRFMSDDDRYGRSGGRSSGRDYGDDDRSSRGRDQGTGWYGDPQGHSEASQRGWENRGNWRGSSSRSDDDYDDRSSNGNRNQQGRGEGRGWYGDSQGHSEAASRGRDDRGGSRSSRGRDDDDDGRRSSRSSGQGGWFGDSRGHAEAARRGWQNRD